MLIYKRKLAEKLRRSAAFAPVVVLSGPRQSGKTSLLKDTFPSYNYVSLDLPSEGERAEHRPDEFLQRHPTPLIVDEIQYSPKLFRHIKIAVDQDRHANGRFILTGSQKFNLMKEVSDSLAGRCLWLELETLSGEEIASHSGPITSYDQQMRLLLRGSYPELWRVPDYPREDFYHSYLSTYIERDVRQVINVGSLRDFERFIRLCAAQNGRLLDKTDLAKSIGINVKTVTSWLSVLESSGIIYLIEPFFCESWQKTDQITATLFC